MIKWNSLLYLIYLQSQFQHPRKGTNFLLHHKTITADLMNFYIWQFEGKAIMVLGKVKVNVKVKVKVKVYRLRSLARHRSSEAPMRRRLRSHIR